MPSSVGCEIDPIQGTERHGMRFRDRNRRGAAAAPERTPRGARGSKAAFAAANAGEPSRCATVQPETSLARSASEIGSGGGIAGVLKPGTELADRQTAVSVASRRARDAQRPKGAEATGIAAEIGAQRRLQRRARPRSGSPEFKTRIGNTEMPVDSITGMCWRSWSCRNNGICTVGGGSS